MTHRRLPVIIGVCPSTAEVTVLIGLLLLSLSPPNDCGNVDGRRPGGSAGSGKNAAAERRRDQTVRLPPCPSEACRCRWAKPSSSGGGSIARCSPSVERPGLAAMFDDRTSSGNAETTVGNVVYLELHVRRANLTELPADGFRQVPTRLLDLTGNRFTGTDSISSSAYAGLETFLNILVLTDCGLTFVPSTSLAHLTVLQVLRLDGNAIVALPAGAFSFGPALRELYVYRNSISRVDPRAFENLSALEKLSLADNQITSLAVGTLSTLGNLTSLDVASNRISSFEPGWLYGLASLQWLEIQSNRVESIGVGTFRGASRLRFMRAENNALTTVDDGAFRPIGRLNYLSIDLSNVSTLTGRSLAGLGRLRTLNLGEIRRDSLPGGFFAPLRRLKYLSLMDYDGNLPSDSAISVDAFGGEFRFRHLNVWLAPIRGCRCSATWIRRLGALGAYVHGLCPDNRPLSCPAGGKSAAAAGSGRAAFASGAKHENDRRKYKSGF